eukprot:m.193816 g.193816  ORF g.193816 m.193816 type:complete len:425 (-) comp53688_c0_seq24:209-1483(-)
MTPRNLSPSKPSFKIPDILTASWTFCSSSTTRTLSNSRSTTSHMITTDSRLRLAASTCILPWSTYLSRCTSSRNAIVAKDSSLRCQPSRSCAGCPRFPPCFFPLTSLAQLVVSCLTHSKLAMYQVFRALAYLHSLNIAHRDVKPHNILINTKTGLVKLCDLGSMKQLNDGSKSVSYICTRHYRAPELLCGSSTYTVAIDAWSAGCTFAELLRQEVLFAGNSSKDQLSKILSVMGSLSERNNFQFCVEIGQSPQHIQLNSPPRDPVNLSSIVPVHVPFDAVVLLTQLLQIVPSKRATMSQALASAWFDDLRVTGATLRSGAPLPPLFNFTSAERVYLERKEVQAEALAPLKQAAASGSPNVKTEGSPLSSSHSRTRRYSLLDLPSSSDDNSPVGFARSTNLLFRCNSYSMINMIHISSNSDSPKS